jgi:outer membrane protein assembly factor BamB
VSISRLLAVLILPAALLGIAACSSTPPAPKPASYPSLPSDRIKLKREWKVSVGKGLDKDNVRLSPSVGEQHVIAASRNGVLLSVARENGKVLWKKDTKLAITAGPTAAYGLIVVATAKGDVVAFSEEDGSQKWTASLGAGVVAAPALAPDMVVVLAADGVIHALSADKGEVRWAYNTTVPPLSLHANAAPLIADGRVYVGTSGGKLVVLDLVSGVAGAEVRVATNNGRSELERMNDIVGGLLLDGNVLYSVGYQSQLTATDVEAGRRRWQFDTSSVNDLASGLGNIYVTDTTGNVLAVDHASGKVVWKQPAYQYRLLTGGTIVGNVLAVGDDDGYIHLLAQSDGQVRGRTSTSGDPLVSLQGVGDELFAWDNEGRLTAWKIRAPR